MKNIAIVDYNLSIIGGAEHVAVNLANELSEYYEVHLVSVHAGTGKLAFPLKSQVQYSAILNQDERLRDSIKKFGKPFVEYVQKNNISTVIMIGDYAGMITIPTKRRTKAKYIFCEHGALMNQWSEKDITFMRLVCALFSNKVITLTKSSRDSYIEKFHIREKKVDFIYNWIDYIGDTPYNKKAKKIMSVGRFSPEKQYDLLLEVADKVLAKYKDWKWEIYGDGETFQTIQTLVKDKNLQNQVVLKGNEKNIQEKYSGYSIFVLTSYREGLPMVLLEAKANHLPMISFDVVTGPSEIIENNVDGYLIESNSIDKMVEKLSYLIEHEEVRERFSRNTEKGLEKFSKQLILQQWKNLIEQL